MKKYIASSISVTVLLYLMVSFIKWDITWISDIGKWNERIRMFMLFAVLAKEALLVCIYNLSKQNRLI